MRRSPATNGKASANGHAPAPSAETAPRRERKSTVATLAAVGKPDGLGPIAPDLLYPLSVLKKLSGLESRAMRQLKLVGLEIIRIGRRDFIEGRSFIETAKKLRDEAGA